MSDDQLDDFLNRLKKSKDKYAKFHKGTDLHLASHIPFGIPTGIPQLDLAIGRPGYPVGRIIEFYGLQMSGKTTAALHAAAAMQRMGGVVVWVDSEKTLDEKQARACGADPETFLVSDAHTIDSIFRSIERVLDEQQAAKLDRPILIVVDSITSVLTDEGLTKDIGEEQRIGQDARVIRFGVRKLNFRIAEQNVTVIFVNHAISNAGQSFGKKYDSAGGNTIKLLASIRLLFSFISTVFDGKGIERTRAGMVSNVKIEKNKVETTGHPDIKLELKDNGFDIYSGLFAALQEIGVIERVNNTVYFFKPSETQLTKAEWPAFVDKEGGPIQIYNWFLEKATEEGTIRSYA